MSVQTITAPLAENLAPPRVTGNRPTTRAAADAGSAREPGGAAAPRRDDALGALLARSVRERTLARYRVAPLPTMRHQWRFGLGLFFDPNCGWYAQVAAMQQRAAALGVAGDARALLPKSTIFGFSPATDGATYTRHMNKPSDSAEWETKLQNHGPLIVSGALGGADWGCLGGVGHYILIVGADATADTLQYMDPLQGDRVRTGDFAHMDARIDDDVYRIWDYALMTDLNLQTGALVAHQ